jgi:hypothetical protein
MIILKMKVKFLIPLVRLGAKLYHLDIDNPRKSLQNKQDLIIIM